MTTVHDRGVLAVIPGVGITYAAFAKIIEQNTNINLRVGMPAHVIRWRKPVSAGDKSKPALVDIQPHFIFTVAINTPDEVTDEDIAAGWVLHETNEGYIKQKPLPIIENVPVHYTGSAAMFMRGKLRPGEVGWTKFADRSIDKWTQTGGPVDPVFAQFHDLSDGFFEPGLRYGKIAKAIDDTKWIIGPEDGSAGLEIDDVDAPNLPNIAVLTTGDNATIDATLKVLLGASAVLGVARLTDTVTADTNAAAWRTQVTVAITQIAALLNAPGPVIGAPGSVTPVTAPLNDFGVIDSASSKVCAED